MATTSDWRAEMWGLARLWATAGRSGKRAALLHCRRSLSWASVCLGQGPLCVRFRAWCGSLARAVRVRERLAAAAWAAAWGRQCPVCHCWRHRAGAIDRVRARCLRCARLAGTSHGQQRCSRAPPASSAYWRWCGRRLGVHDSRAVWCNMGREGSAQAIRQ